MPDTPIRHAHRITRQLDSASTAANRVAADSPAAR